MATSGVAALILDKGNVQDNDGQPREGPRGGPEETVPTRGIPATPRAHTVDLGQVGIPSPPRGPAGGYTAGTKVWVKLRLGREDEKERKWYEYMGEVESECHQVRGNLRLKIKVPSLDGMQCAGRPRLHRLP